MTDKNLLIDTPENVPLEAEIAGFGTRSVASLVDYTILTVVLGIVSLIYYSAVSDDSGDLSGWLIAAWILVLFILLTFYHLFFEFLWNGQTPGKRMFGLRVVQSNGLPLTTSAALIRNFVRVFDFFPIFYGVGLIAMFASTKAQRLGDLAADTIVIREQGNVSLGDIKEDYRVTYWHLSRYDPIPTTIQVDRLTDDDRREIVSYLNRRNELEQREYIVEGFAKSIAERMENPELVDRISSPKAAEQFLEMVARAFELAQAPEQPKPKNDDDDIFKSASDF